MPKQADCLGIRAPLEGRGGDLHPAHRAKLSLEVEWKRGRELRIREAGVRYLASEARGRAVPPRSIARARRCKPPPASIPLAAARKKRVQGRNPCPQPGGGKSFGEAQSRSISAPRGRSVLGVDGVNRRPRNSVRLCDGGFIEEL